jgi:hypothetical protein
MQRIIALGAVSIALLLGAAQSASAQMQPAPYLGPTPPAPYMPPTNNPMPVPAPPQPPQSPPQQPPQQ